MVGYSGLENTNKAEGKVMDGEQIRAEILTRALDDLKRDASDVINRIMGDLYTEYLPHVETDTESNISYRVEGCLRNIAEGKIRHAGESSFIYVSDGYGHEHAISISGYNLNLKPLCDLMPDHVMQERIKQLEREVDDLKNMLNSRTY